jgi:capsid protein
VPADVVPGTENDAYFVAQSMPWIDPLKEANAWTALVRAGFASEVEVLRKRGVNPSDMLEQIDTWRKEAKKRGMVFTSDGAHSETSGQPGAATSPAGAAAAAATRAYHEAIYAAAANPASAGGQDINAGV